MVTTTNGICITHKVSVFSSMLRLQAEHFVIPLAFSPDFRYDKLVEIRILEGFL